MRALLVNKIILTISTTVLILSFIITPFSASADFNQQINYQGKLTDSTGVAVADGTYNMKFWLIASSTAATSTAVWAETRISGDKVQVTNGLFSVMLGGVTSLASVDFNQTLYLGVEIGGSGSPTWDGEMSPRKILGAVPAAFEAENAQTLAGIATTSFLRSDAIDTMEATSSSALLTLIQNGAGKLLSIFSGVTEMFTISNTGNVGIATTTPSEKLTVIGNTYLGGGLTLTGALKDSTTATGTLGMVLKTTGTSTQWVATSTLGLGNGTFLGLTDTPSSFTANRLLFTNSGGTALTDSANLVFDGTNFGIGSTTPSHKLTVSGDTFINNKLYFNSTNTDTGIVFPGDNYLAHSSWKETKDATGILLPMYLYPSDIYNNTSYNGVIDLKKRYHNVPLYVILNPSNGTGGVTDGNFTAAIQRLKGAGAIVLGYVASNYTASTTAEVEGEIDDWVTYYPDVDGIFIDEMTNTASTTAQAYYNELTRHVHSRGLYPSIGNPGAGTVGEYFASSSADVIVINETSSYPSEVTLKGDYDNGYADFDYNKRAGLVYGISDLSTASTTLLKKYLGMIYVTDDTLPNPWDTVSPHLEELFEFLSAENKRFFTDIYVDGNVGIATTTPAEKLTVIGNTYLGGGLTLTGALKDSTTATGTLGMILKTTGTSTQWVATSTLGLGNGTFLGLTDTPSSFTANRLLFTNSGATALTDSADLTFDGTNFGVGSQNGIAFGGTRYLYASSTNDSIVFGENAGATFKNTTTDNIAIGFDAGRYASTSASDFNSFIGNSAGYNNTGSYNNLFGVDAGYNNTGSDNNFIGDSVGYKNTGDFNEIIGTESGYNLQATSSTIIGSYAYRGGAGSTAFQAVNNVALGYKAGYAAQTGASNNILLGYQAADNLTTGANNIVIGYDVDIASTTRSNQLNIGNLIFGTGIDGTGTTLSSGNIGIGSTTPSSKLTVAGSVDITNTATSSAAITLRDTIGGISLELRAGTSTLANTFVGLSAGSTNSTGINNSALGKYALKVNTTGSQNTANGSSALATNSSGSDNTAIGSASQLLNTTGSYNTVAGSNSLVFNQTGSANTVSGNEAGYGAISQSFSSSTLMGYRAGFAITSGSRNNLFGYRAGDNITSGQGNIILGYDIDAPSATGNNQLSIGNLIFGTSLDGTGTTLSSGNIGIGSTTPSSKLTVAGSVDITNTATSSAAITLRDTIGGISLELRAGTSTLLNNFIGVDTGRTNTTGSQNTANGYKAFFSNTTGSDNTVNGYRALYNNTTGSNNTALGSSAGRYLANGVSGNDTASNSLYLGYNTKALAASGDNEIVIGSTAVGAGSNTVTLGSTTITKTILQGNIGIGTTTPSSKLTVAGSVDITNAATSSAAITLRDPIGNISLELRAGTSTLENTIIGMSAGSAITTGDSNTAIGVNALYLNTTGGSNTAVGWQSLYTNATGTSNTANGFRSLYANLGSQNTAYGYGSLRTNTVGADNVATGLSALNSNTTGSYNTANGTYAMYENIDGDSNTAFGYASLNSNVSGNKNTALGRNAGYDVNTAVNTGSNTIIGYNTGRGITTGVNNTILGANVTGLSSALSNNIIIADGAGNRRINVDSNGNVGIATTTPVSLLAMEKLTFTGAGIAGINQYLKSTNVTASAVQYGNFGYLYASNTATTTIAGNMFKIEDNTTFGNTVRGFEVQTDRGTNTLGENTALSGFARTFGVRGTTKGDAGGTYEPAGVFAETQGTTQGNAIRGYSASITTTSLLKLFQDTSTFVGTGLLMNFGNSGGSFSSTTASKFIDLQNAGTSMFTVGAYGALTIGDGTTNHNAGLAVGYGGICVDNDGSCNASTTGRVSAVSYHTGNSDLAETYFSSENLKTGDVVYVKSGLSIGKAGENNKDKVIGVVSTKPGLLLGSDDTSLKAGEKAYPIALKGRVPVRLSNENGEIKVGDELMLSSVEGVVMKATSTGKIVGVALEDFEGSRAYSDTYINQFGDDLVDPVFEPINHDNDPRINDGCYFGGGNASGDEVCVPLVSTTTDGRIAEAEAIAKREAEERALARLANVSAEKITLSNGQEVNVGQIVMFVDLRHRYLDDNGVQMMSALLANASTTNATEVNETVWQRLVNLANNFVDGVLSVFTLKADKVEIKDQLCVDGVCVTGDDLRQLLNKNNNSGSGEGTNNNPEPVVEEVIENNSEEENVETTVVEEPVAPPLQEPPTPSFEPEIPIPEIITEPPAPEPSPESTSEPVPETAPVPEPPTP